MTTTPEQERLDEIAEKLTYDIDAGLSGDWLTINERELMQRQISAVLTEALAPVVKEVEKWKQRCDPQLDPLFRELEQLRADNERLREVLRKWHRNTGGQCIECHQGGVHVPFIDHDDDCSIGLALNPTLTKEVM